MARLLFSFLFLLLIGGGGNSLVSAQQQVSGIVISSENEEPVTGATITVDGASIGTVSDPDGKFTLGNIPSGSNRLTVSFPGYQRQFTGSASVVNAAATGKIQTSSVTSALEGRATGVQTISSTGQPGCSRIRLYYRQGNLLRTGVERTVQQTV